ncbi:hypothetical protein JCM10207_007419 [Rhodosporidiobolus poonsookiae]
MLTWPLVKMVFAETTRNRLTLTYTHQDVINDFAFHGLLTTFGLVYALSRWMPTLWMVQHLKLTGCALLATIGLWAWAFAPLPVAVRICVACQMVMACMGFLLFIGLFLLEAAYYFSLLTSLVCVLVVMCEESYLAHRGAPSKHAASTALAQARAMKWLANQEATFAAKRNNSRPLPSLEQLSPYLIHSMFGNKLQELLFSLRQKWRVLLHADLGEATRAHAHLLKMARTFHTDEREVAVLLATEKVLEQLIGLRSGYREPVTFAAVVDELAATLFNILPFACLKHLARPVTLHAFLPLLITYPGYRYLTMRERECWSWPRTDPYDEVARFAFLLSKMDDPTLVWFVTAFLEAEQVDELAANAERLSHNAILDAVLAWKARKLDAESASRGMKDE